MEIYVFRHGIAEDPKPGQDDAARKLTPEGKQKLERILAVARSAGVRPDVVLSSPYRRARETAQMARAILQLDDPIVETETLTPMQPPEMAWQEIRGFKQARQLMLAGHEPHLGLLVSYLIGAQAGAIEMKKGAIARVDVASLGPRPRGALVWLLTAKLAGA